MHVTLDAIWAWLNPALNNAGGLLALLISGWAVWAFHKYLTPYLGAQMEAQFRDVINTALKNGVAIFLTRTKQWEIAHNSVGVQNLATEWAAQFAIDHAPQAISYFGLSPEALANKALAYIPAPPTAPTITLGQPSPTGQTPAEEEAETVELNKEQIRS